MNSLFVGLDVGSRSCHQVVLAPDGPIICNRQFPTRAVDWTRPGSHALSGLALRQQPQGDGLCWTRTT